MRKTKRLAVAAVAVAMFGLGGCDSDDPKGSPNGCTADAAIACTHSSATTEEPS